MIAVYNACKSDLFLLLAIPKDLKLLTISPRRFKKWILQRARTDRQSKTINRKRRRQTNQVESPFQKENYKNSSSMRNVLQSS